MATSKAIAIRTAQALESLDGRVAALQEKIDRLLELAEEQSTPVMLVLDEPEPVETLEPASQPEPSESTKRKRPAKRA